MMWTSLFPLVLTIAAIPASVTPMKQCACSAEPIASIATLADPSVPFLNPIGNETPEANSRWS